jgi:hypothetical protein
VPTPRSLSPCIPGSVAAAGLGLQLAGGAPLSSAIALGTC